MQVEARRPALAVVAGFTYVSNLLGRDSGAIQIRESNVDGRFIVTVDGEDGVFLTAPHTLQHPENARTRGPDPFDVFVGYVSTRLAQNPHLWVAAHVARLLNLHCKLE